MQQWRRGLHPRLGLLASIVLVVGACGTAASPSPSTSAAASAPAASAPASQAASEAPYERHGLPGERRRPVRHARVQRQHQEDLGARPADGRVPDVRAGSGVPAEGRVQRLRHPGRRLSREARPGQVDPGAAQRDRAVQAQGLGQGQPDHVRGQPRLLGHRAQDPEPRVPLERPGRAAAPRAPVRQRRRHRQPGHRRHRHDQGRQHARVLPPRGHERLLPRHEQHDQAVGQRERPQGRSPWASTGSGSSTTSIRKARRSRRTSRRAPSPYGCEGDDWYDFDAGRGQEAPDRRRLRLQQDRTSCSSAPRSAATSRIRRRSRPRSRAS